jgi:hypothetical protein
MSEQINPFSRLSRTQWCGNFSCSHWQLIAAIRATRSTDVGEVGLYLATRYALETFEGPNSV